MIDIDKAQADIATYGNRVERMQCDILLSILATMNNILQSLERLSSNEQRLPG